MHTGIIGAIIRIVVGRGKGVAAGVEAHHGLG